MFVSGVSRNISGSWMCVYVDKKWHAMNSVVALTRSTQEAGDEKEFHVCIEHMFFRLAKTFRSKSAVRRACGDGKWVFWDMQITN